MEDALREITELGYHWSLHPVLYTEPLEYRLTAHRRGKRKSEVRPLTYCGTHMGNLAQMMLREVRLRRKADEKYKIERLARELRAAD